jgi:hypothetical protein
MGEGAACPDAAVRKKETGKKKKVAARGVDANFPNCKGRHFYL